jgi:hypothetical protein
MKLLMFQAAQFCFASDRGESAAAGGPPNGFGRSGVHAGASEDNETDDPNRVRRVREARQCTTNATVVFIHAEAHDVEREAPLIKRCAKNIKWISNKRNLRHVVLHSFAHLSESKAPVEFGEAFIAALAQRLTVGDYTVSTTPYGQSIPWELNVFGDSLAKVFKSL